MTERFQLQSPASLLGLTAQEVRTAWERVLPGRPYPQRSVPTVVAKGLVANFPTRFEFEINRQRGYAFDNGEPHEAAPV